MTQEAEEQLRCSLPTPSQSDPSIKQSGHNKANFSSFHFGSYATSTTEKRLCEAIEEFKDTILISGKMFKEKKKEKSLKNNSEPGKFMSCRVL